MSEELTQLAHKDIKPLRDKMLKEQKGVCPLCERSISNPALDHCHKTGRIRAVLCSGCNALLGRIENNCARHLVPYSLLGVYLSNVAEYLYKPHKTMIHPLSKPKEPKFPKALFNKLAKLYSVKYPSRKRLKYPLSGKLTKQLALLVEEFKEELN